MQRLKRNEWKQIDKSSWSGYRFKLGERIALLEYKMEQICKKLDIDTDLSIEDFEETIDDLTMENQP